VRRILANLLWEDDLAPRRTHPPRTVLETVSGLATLLRAFAAEGDHLWTPSPVDPERVLEVPGVSRPILESGPIDALSPAEATLPWGVVSPSQCRDALRGTPWGVSEAATSAATSQTPRGHVEVNSTVLSASETPHGVPRRASLHWGEALHDLLWILPSSSPVITAAIHHRAFCLQIAEELGCALPGSQMVDSLEDLDRILASSRCPQTWVLKAPLSASGRNRYIERMGPKISDPRPRRRVDRLFEHHGPLLFEPWMNRTADFGVSALLDQYNLQIVGVHGQKVDIKGQFAGIDLQPVLSETERARLLETVEAVGAAMRQKGYTGPFGIDAWRYRKENGEEVLHPLGEINARMTFGLVAWALAERLAGAVRLLFGRNLPAAAEGKNTEIVPLLATGPEKGSAAWIELATPHVKPSTP